MLYRSEIDGLRAVAVASVMLFHAGVPFFRGGFVGVDVFFVISGYLITKIIWDRSQKGTFSILQFYERRARRILPALALVVLLCFPFAWLLMLPDDFENFGQSVVATFLFSNNILLWLTDGYWSLAVDFKPLVHTWSLGVEEQFYLVFPMIFMLFWSRGEKALVGLFLGLGVASFLFSVWLGTVDPIANFYLAPTRFWELIAGALCSRVNVGPNPTRDRLLSSLGLVLIVVPMFLYGKDTPFPGVAALPPVVGTALVILYASKNTPCFRLLSTRGFVGLGLVSYSAYLWHQPLFAFSRIYSLDEPSVGFLVLMAGVSICLAAFSYKYVESPFRDASRLSANAVVMTLLPSAAIFIGAGLLVHFNQGVPERWFEGQSKEAHAGMHVAFNESVFRYQRDVFLESQQKKVLVFGDSFGRDFINSGLEAGFFSDHEIIYRSEPKLDCLERAGFIKDFPVSAELLEKADYAIVAFSKYDQLECLPRDVQVLAEIGSAQVIVIGVKNFGYNLNPYARLSTEDRKNAKVDVLPDVVELNNRMGKLLPRGVFVDVIGLLGNGTGRLPVFTPEGELISQDRLHYTRSGAAFVGKIIFTHPLLEMLR